MIIMVTCKRRIVFQEYENSFSHKCFFLSIPQLSNQARDPKVSLLLINHKPNCIVLQRQVTVDPFNLRLPHILFIKASIRGFA